MDRIQSGDRGGGQGVGGVLETVRPVVQQARHVRIDDQALAAFCDNLLGEDVPVPPWEDACHFNDRGEATVGYLLVLDSLNFCFWPLPGRQRWEITYGSKGFSGYYGMSMALRHALERGIPLTRAEYLAELGMEDLKKILGGRGDLQLFRERLQILRELGRNLLAAYGGEARRLVESARGSAPGLVRLVVETFPSFRDEAVYRGRRVCFYKRAQIFVADLHGAFGGEQWGRFQDMDRLTAFADYKLPQVLRQAGILCYAPSLARKVDERLLLEAGGPEEVEIRAAALWAVERIRREMRRRGREVPAFQIDWLLWTLGQVDHYREKPYHRTVTIFY